MSRLKLVLFTAAACTLATSAAFADKPPDRGPTPGIGWGHGWGHGWGNGGGKSYVVPGPVAGVGLPAALLVGGYLWFRRNRRQDD